MICNRTPISEGGTCRVCILSAPGTIGAQIYLEAERLLLYNWKMTLQRYTNGRWSTIGTRYGYVSRDSPSHRSFTNIASKNAMMRVKIDLMNPSEVFTTIYSPQIRF